MFDASNSLEKPLRVIINNEGQQRDGGVLEIPILFLLQKWMTSIHACFGGIDKQGRFPDYPWMVVVGTHADQLAPGQPLEERERRARKVIEKAMTATEEKAYSNTIVSHHVVDNTTAGKGDIADKGFEEISSVVSTVVKKLTRDTSQLGPV